MKRKKEAEPITYEEFLKQEKKEKQAGIEKALALSHIFIDNNKSIAAFKKNIRAFLRFLIS